MESDLDLGSLTEDFFGTSSVLETINTDKEEVGVIRSVKFLQGRNKNWSEGFFDKISLANEISIHLGSWVYKGTSLGFVYYDQDVIFDLYISSAVKNEHESMIYLEDIPTFVLQEFGKPLVVKEGGWDLIHLSFLSGFIDFFFACPLGAKL